MRLRGRLIKKRPHGALNTPLPLPSHLTAGLSASGLAALAAEPSTSFVAVSGNARIGKSTLLNELVRVAASAPAAAPFMVGASAEQVTAGIDFFTAKGGGGGGDGNATTFLDAEGRGGHGQEQDRKSVV